VIFDAFIDDARKARSGFVSNCIGLGKRKEEQEEIIYNPSHTKYINMAFIPATGVSLSVRQFVGSTSTRGCVSISRRARAINTVRASMGGDGGPPADGYEFDGTVIVDKANEFVADVTERPIYYTKLASYAAGALVALTILKAVIAAVESIPVLPSMLELVGLGYTSWFVWRYVIFKESREELMGEIEDLIGRARPTIGE